MSWYHEMPVIFLRGASLLVCFILGPLFTLELSAVWLLKGLSFTLSVIFLFGPEWTKLPNFDVFGSFPVVTGGSSGLCCFSSLTSTSLPDLSLLALFPPCILASSKLCILGLGTWTFPEVTIFDVVCFF